MSTYPHVRLSALGTLGAAGGDEIWSCSVKIVIRTAAAQNVPIAPVASDLAELATAGFPIWGALIGFNVGNQSADDTSCSPLVALTATKAAAVAANGKDDPALDSFTYDPAASIHGGGVVAPTGDMNGYLNCPYQIALAFTLKGSTFKRGSASHGRFFLPMPNLSLGGVGLTDGRMSPGAVSQFAGLGSNLVHDLNQIVLSSGNLPVVSNIGSSTDLAGLRFQQVTSVSVDNRPDTIRTRSNKLGGKGIVTIPVPV